MKITVFSIVSEVSKPYSSPQMDYFSIYQFIPKELKSGKTPIIILDESIDQLKNAGNNLAEYLQSLNTVSNLINFYLLVCEKFPQLERSCSDDVGWLREHHRTIERTVRYVNDILTGNYDQKKLRKKIKNINPTILQPVEDVRSILSKQALEPFSESFSTQEQQLHEPLPAAAYYPKNAVSNQ